MTMLLTEWKPNFNLKKDMLRTIPILVKLPQLPLYLWGAKSLSKIDSALGTPLMTNECMKNRYRISYARILVDINITQEMLKEITIRDIEGEKMQQTVESEWRLSYCTKCHKIGHQCEGKIQRQITKKCIPKENTTQHEIHKTICIPEITIQQDNITNPPAHQSPRRNTMIVNHD
ncbi:uncharacterized protein LOC131649995 [Vicia villosa]|uniref:uncharacterized protein LOC131649995 n=1 Tax=Vicia villosa TaxID=3911 RepID=UPI00273CD722|nr:uncharacterized protein LOC131649995 [Vicia villosa]